MKQITAQQLDLPPDLDVIASILPLVTCNVNAFERFLEETPPDSTNRTRWQFRFALNMRCKIEHDLAHWLEDLKLKRQFSAVVRDALRLYRDLQVGQVGVLHELFPDVVRRIERDAHPASEDFAQMVAEIAKLQAMLKTAPPAAQPVLRPVAAPDDDGLLVVRKAKSDGKASAENFLSAAFGLQKIQ